MALQARIIRMWMEMHLIFLYIYIILAVAVFNNKFNNLHFWTRVPSGQASGMRQGRAWGSGSSFGRPWPSNTRPCPQIPGPARPCTTLNLDMDDKKSGSDGGNGSVGTGRSARPESVNETSSETDSSEDSSPEEPEAPPKQPRPPPPLPKSCPKPQPAYRGAKNVVSPPNDTALDDLP